MPKKPAHVLHLDDCRNDAFGDNGWLVTLVGYSWDQFKDASGCGDHVQGFDTLADARRAWGKKNLHQCDCPTCQAEPSYKDLKRN